MQYWQVGLSRVSSKGRLVSVLPRDTSAVFYCDYIAMLVVRTVARYSSARALAITSCSERAFSPHYTVVWARIEYYVCYNSPSLLKNSWIVKCLGSFRAGSIISISVIISWWRRPYSSMDISGALRRLISSWVSFTNNLDPCGLNCFSRLSKISFKVERCSTDVRALIPHRILIAVYAFSLSFSLGS